MTNEELDPIHACRDDIDAGLFNVAAIVADESSCDWAYSIGLHRNHDHPELAIIGVEAPLAAAIVETLADEVALGRTIVAGSTVTLSCGLELLANPVAPLWASRGDWFNLGREVMATWGERWPACLQLLWADPGIGYPDPGGDPQWAFRQPVLAG